MHHVPFLPRQSSCNSSACNFAIKFTLLVCCEHHIKYNQVVHQRIMGTQFMNNRIDHTKQTFEHNFEILKSIVINLHCVTVQLTTLDSALTIALENRYKECLLFFKLSLHNNTTSTSQFFWLFTGSVLLYWALYFGLLAHPNLIQPIFKMLSRFAGTIFP